MAWPCLPAAVKAPLILRLLSLTGLLICGYLAGLKLAGKTSSLAGCGQGSGCGNVLGSEWSQLFGIPVSLLAFVIYLALLIASFRPSRSLYGALAICLTGAALWFVGILYLTIRAVCPWCLAMHTIGVVTSIVLVASLRDVPPSKSLLRFAPVAALLALLTLVVGQILGPKPDTHASSKEALRDQGGAIENAGRRIAFTRGGKRYNTDTMPHLGPPDAKYVMVKYFDYTCISCRKVHEQLQFVEKKHPGLFCVILLPVPLNRSCNPFITNQSPKHQHACELARLSVAAWKASPTKWPKVHEQLISTLDLPPEVAEAAVGQIVGHDQLELAKQDPSVESLIKSSVKDFGQLKKENSLLPKLMCAGGKVLHGEPRSAEALLSVLNQIYDLVP
ncbi:MAG: hypothetical protein CMN06_06765 [Roseibacillus sp.]|nr:hypothetical protein [Roseibacillus sp.]